jgi:hypothetical protein
MSTLVLTAHVDHRRYFGTFDVLKRFLSRDIIVTFWQRRFVRDKVPDVPSTRKVLLWLVESSSGTALMAVMIGDAMKHNEPIHLSSVRAVPLLSYNRHSLWYTQDQTDRMPL